jgi:hypothetical protein
MNDHEKMNQNSDRCSADSDREFCRTKTHCNADNSMNGTYQYRAKRTLANKIVLIFDVKNKTLRSIKSQLINIIKTSM